MKKVVCTHLFNDFSGSPLVLSTVVKGFINKGIEVDVLTSSKEDGFLSNLPVRYVDNKYQFVENKLIRIVYFFFTQLLSFCKMWQYRNQEVVVYVNTLLPFGVAIAGRMMNKKVVFHIHETSVKPPVLKNFLKWVCEKTASEIIYVSDFLRQQEPIGDIPSVVIHNALSNEFINKAKKHKNGSHPFTALMLCSLKGYKGIDQFVHLATELPHIKFELVLNAEQKNIDDYFTYIRVPETLTLIPKQTNVHPFYQRACLVINLSHPEQWVETFGMTLLEGMQYGIPAISPPVGGCIEVVDDGINGYQIDQRQLDTLIEKINELYTNEALYNRMAEQAKLKAQQFSVNIMWDKIFQTVFGKEATLETKMAKEEITVSS